MGSEQNRFPPSRERQKRWGGCWGAFSCFSSQKGGKRIVPASRIPENSMSAAQSNGHQVVGLTNQTTTLTPSLLAPPSSPASISNSALPSTAQSPSCFLSLSANSPGGPSSAMFATGPYAHETQLVSPPVFSTFTTEPSTAPFTPPPELAHVTTPSSPDVPFAQFLSSSVDLKSPDKTNYITSNDLQATYLLYPGSPASSFISPISRNSGDDFSSSFPERDSSKWDASLSPNNAEYIRIGSGRLSGHDKNSVSMVSQDTNFFCPATFAQFYLDQDPPFPHTGGRLSVSRDSDVPSNIGNGQQNRQTRSSKQDADEIEAYRASFGFSADEIITSTQYVEITDVMDDSFTMTPFPSDKSLMKASMEHAVNGENRTARSDLLIQSFPKAEVNLDEKINGQVLITSNHCEDRGLKGQGAKVSKSSTAIDYILTDEEEDIRSRRVSSKSCRKYDLGLSCSDAEIDYRRGSTTRKAIGDVSWLD